MPNVSSRSQEYQGQHVASDGDLVQDDGHSYCERYAAATADDDPDCLHLEPPGDRQDAAR